MRLHLGNAANGCIVLPALGGSLGAWTVAGQEMLRCGSDDDMLGGDPLKQASFPLVPFSNRIGNGRFIWNGTVIELARNFAPEPHAIHGLGWQRPWSIVEASRDAALLALVHGGDASWPWPFEATQSIAVGDATLSMSLRAVNRAAHPAPLAFGHHPYFDSAGATLRFAARQVWQTGSDGLPRAPQRPAGDHDFGDGNMVAGRSVDNCYVGLSGAVRIEWRDRPLALEIEAAPPLTAAVVFIPRGGDFFCFEPVPHIINALNLPGEAPAMPVIAPGEAFAMTVTFRAVSAT